MALPDYRGARGSNAGDDFHELWALRQALDLLDHHARLSFLTVEGLAAEDERGAPPDTWDGVDCALYYGGDSVESAARIEVVQVKYSSAAPRGTWTVARLTTGKKQRQDNSVLRRLANAFAGLRDKRPDLVAAGNIAARLVSIQPVDPAVTTALSSIPSTALKRNAKTAEDRARLAAASGLRPEAFKVFASALDLSGCGSGSRSALEERVLASISAWTDDDARAALDGLRQFIRKMMMPEAKGDRITRHSLLARLGFSDFGGLFPCPTAITPVTPLVSRSASRDLAREIVNGTQRICLHGGGGCGKTTVLQELEALLPSGSILIVFDCFGGGHYLDSDAYRHRREDAFLQLSNDLAIRLRIPWLLTRSPGTDYPKAFKRRLERASEVLASQSGDALLVVAIDAADNSVSATATRSPREASFVHDFMGLGDLPGNVRFVVTARTGRLSILDLPLRFVQRELRGFIREDTASHVRSKWASAPDEWIDDFDHLSHGNPRVQRYAFERAGVTPESALEYLRPNGKLLGQLFQEQLDFAVSKEGSAQPVESLCTGLVALPRPVPVRDLAAVAGLAPARVRDLCADLAPGIDVRGDSISFADEDFEDFLRRRSESDIKTMRDRVADHFVAGRNSDAYAATHVAAALFAANRRLEIIELVTDEPVPKAIPDPVLRRQVQLERLRIAMRVCRETESNVDAILTLLTGAEALKTNEAFRRTLIENPDLAVEFARDTSSRLILRDPMAVSEHGRLLFHLLSADARAKDAVSVREGHRRLVAWLDRRKEQQKDREGGQSYSQPREWSVESSDVGAQIEASLRIKGPRDAVRNLLGWSPRSVAFRVATDLSFRLLASGETELVRRCLTEGKIPKPWDLLLLVPLALARREVDPSLLASRLAALLRRGLIKLDGLQQSFRDDTGLADYLDAVLTACEVVVARGGDVTRVTPVLELFANRENRRRDRLFTSRIAILDLTLRSHALLERLSGRSMTLETYWIDPETASKDLPAAEIARLNRSDSEKKEELKGFVGPLLGVYDVRAQVLLGSLPPGQVRAPLEAAVDGARKEYSFSRTPFARSMAARAALSLSQLSVVPGLDLAALLDQCRSLLGPQPASITAEASLLTAFALHPSLHPAILQIVTTLAKGARETRQPAADKLSVLVRLARTLLPISSKDAGALFNEAIEVAGEIDAEVLHELALFEPLTERAGDHTYDGTRRELARDIAIVASDAGVRLGGHDGFPWRDVARTLSRLDVCFALAASARWEDSSIVDQFAFLPAVLEVALASGCLSPPQVVALTSFLDPPPADLIVSIAAAVEGMSEPGRMPLIEELARQEALGPDMAARRDVIAKLLSISAGDLRLGFWLEQLSRAGAFHSAQSSRSARDGGEQPTPRSSTEASEGARDPLAAFHWDAALLTSPEGIVTIVREARASTLAGPFVSAQVVLDRLRSRVEVRDFTAHLDALSGCIGQLHDDEVAEAIARCLRAWSTSPSVRRWSRGVLPGILSDQLPAFSRWLDHGQSPLPQLLKDSELDHPEVCDLLLRGLERHVDGLELPHLYALIRLTVQHLTADDASAVATRFAQRLVQRLPLPERERWDLSDIPTDVADALARFLYALMGDVDLRTRWRSAHALRSLVRLSDRATSAAIMPLFDRKSENSYRKPTAPFYWLAARLWLVMSLDRIASENPTALKCCGPQLLDIALDDRLPHVLIRSFAKAASLKLARNGALKLDPRRRRALDLVNTSTLRRARRRRTEDRGFDRYRYVAASNRRFHFDSMDTLPYWYSSALRVFGDVTRDEFLDAAERWIVDRWGVSGNPWRWEDEPRRERLPDRLYPLMENRPGSGPTLERFHTYLERHAMWCAVGELLATRPLAASGRDGEDGFEHWLRKEGLNSPLAWVSDLRGMKPLEDRLWFSPDDVESWVEGVTEADFQAELGLGSDDGTMVITGHHETGARGYRLLARVSTALISPNTGSALVRALQTIPSAWDYRIPPAGDSLEIDEPPYRLLGWILSFEHSLGIDGSDPLCHQIRAIECRPGRKLSSVLGLKLNLEPRAGWYGRSGSKPLLIYDAWGDESERAEGSSRYDSAVRSNGWRLRAKKEAVMTFLKDVGLDLIVEIEITRRNRGYDDYGHDEKETKDATFDRVFLFRKDGSIEGAEGHIGTWAAPSPGTRSRRWNRHARPLDGPSSS